MAAKKNENEDATAEQTDKKVKVWVQGSSATPVSWSIQERRSCTWLSTDA